MTKEEQIRALALRILGPMGAFRIADPSSDAGERRVGGYDVPGGPGEIGVTTEGLTLVRSEGLVRVPFAQIVAVSMPSTKDHERAESRRLIVVLADGSTAALEIVGGSGRFLDAFEFARFLDRAAKLARGGEGAKGGGQEKSQP